MHSLYIAQGFADAIRKRTDPGNIKKIKIVLGAHDYSEKDFIAFHLKEILGQEIEIAVHKGEKTYIDKIEIS